MLSIPIRMALSRDKRRAHRKQVREKLKSTSIDLVQPDLPSPTREKIKVVTKAQSVLLKGEGRSMTMDID